MWIYSNHLRITFYVISAYQNDYLTLYNAKFEYDKKSKSLTGPSELITNWNNDMYNCCAAAYGISEILSENISIQKFIKLLDDNDNGNIFKILINSLKILYGKYTIKNGEIIPVKAVTIFKTINNINDFLNNNNKGED
ncbi:hypothetical protein [Clostridium tyrobutyricum]|uniref:hypothetical protein n=2 Tax=Clostridium tyrobutyricum TaxID=1519 RepID=UPI000ACE4013|nr:hypothetical protein [Clostridium tyrobutyricum]MBV4416540.1 hypothetical protein [Clostridium tyrobutyricum]